MDDLIPVRCDECGATDHLTPREEMRLRGPYRCSDRCEDTAALREDGQRDAEDALREYDAEYAAEMPS